MATERSESGEKVLGDFKDWQKRVIEERDSLREKINKLITALATDEFIVTMTKADNNLLHDRLENMQGYINILNIRISKF